MIKYTRIEDGYLLYDENKESDFNERFQLIARSEEDAVRLSNGLNVEIYNFFEFKDRTAENPEGMGNRIDAWLTEDQKRRTKAIYYRKGDNKGNREMVGIDVVEEDNHIDIVLDINKFLKTLRKPIPVTSWHPTTIAEDLSEGRLVLFWKNKEE